MHNPESARENETQNVLWDFEIQTNHLISARRPHIGIFLKKKKKSPIVDFDVPVDHRMKIKESEKKNKYLNLPEN